MELFNHISQVSPHTKSKRFHKHHHRTSSAHLNSRERPTAHANKHKKVHIPVSLPPVQQPPSSLPSTSGMDPRQLKNSTVLPVSVSHPPNIPNNLFICLYFWHVELIRNARAPSVGFHKRNNKTLRPWPRSGGAQNISSKFVSSAQKFSRIPTQEAVRRKAAVSRCSGRMVRASSAEVAAPLLI